MFLFCFIDLLTLVCGFKCIFNNSFCSSSFFLASSFTIHWSTTVSVLSSLVSSLFTDYYIINSSQKIFYICLYVYQYVYIEICEAKKKNQKSKGIYINLSRYIPYNISIILFKLLYKFVTLHNLLNCFYFFFFTCEFIVYLISSSAFFCACPLGSFQEGSRIDLHAVKKKHTHTYAHAYTHSHTWEKFLEVHF